VSPPLGRAFAGRSLEELAHAPAWPTDRVAELEGRCRGVVMRDWGAHVRARWGEAGLAEVREAAALSPEDLPDAPAPRVWYPVAHQLVVTRAIADRHLGGDLLALEPLLVEAGRSARDRVVEWAMRRVGPGFVLKHAHRVHRDLYDRGEVTSDVRRGEATLRWEGAGIFAEPTWRVLQCFALRGAVRLLGRELGHLEAASEGGDDLTLRLGWRR